MRKGMLMLGAAIGAAAAYYYMNSPSATREEKETWTPPQAKHGIQGPEERESVASLIDEVVHEPDVPNTPIKQAFEHALEER